jgi:hypothetical protein
MSKPEKQKSKYPKFILTGLALWVIVIILYFIIFFIRSQYGDIYIEETRAGFLYKFNQLLLIYGIFGIPLILILSVLMKILKVLADKYL